MRKLIVISMVMIKLLRKYSAAILKKKEIENEFQFPAMKVWTQETFCRSRTFFGKGSLSSHFHSRGLKFIFNAHATVIYETRDAFFRLDIFQYVID